MFTFSVVVVDLPTDCILSFLFPAETDVLVPVFSQSKDVVVVNFVVVLKFPIMFYVKMVIGYHVQTISGKPGWKENGTLLFGSFQRKISRNNGTSEKVVLFFRKQHSNRKFVFRFFKAIFDTSFRPSRSVVSFFFFFDKWN